ncbi:DM13 domain-containing protein [Brevundimonas sp. C43]|uniref:DM13 domain-containing protein n=1 Tax=Brevundimonas sp. C43 TaxID=3068314 RepID=UPI00273D4DEA|nr:DM13 domain-containing protein [Brevundimonas sp. C43]
MKTQGHVKGSDLLHWGTGEVRIAPDRIAHLGRLSPGPDYKLYLAPRFVETKAAFLEIKSSSVRLGDVKTFNGFILQVPRGVDVDDYSAVVIWCEAFDQFISAAEYRVPHQALK